MDDDRHIPLTSIEKAQLAATFQLEVQGWPDSKLIQSAYQFKSWGDEYSECNVILNEYLRRFPEHRYLIDFNMPSVVSGENTFVITSLDN
jgi:hypothetical protein